MHIIEILELLFTAFQCIEGLSRMIHTLWGHYTWQVIKVLTNERQVLPGTGAEKVPGLGEVTPPGHGGQLPHHVARADLLAFHDLSQCNQRQLVIRANHRAHIGPRPI